MGESVGTAWIMIIVVTLIVLFSGYLAFSINYSKSYRVKDGIIERIHKHNGFVKDGSTKGTLSEIDDYLAQINYNAKGNCYKYCQELGDSAKCIGVNGKTYDPQNRLKGNMYNYCIFKIKNSVKGTSGRTADASTAYYKVVVFFSLQIGNLSFLSNLHTTGETSTLYYPKDYIFETN